MVDITVVMAIIAALSLIVSIVTLIATRDKDHRQEGTDIGSLLSDIGYIKNNTDEIKHKQEQADARHYALAERVTAVEASAKQAHKRIDRIEGKDELRER